MGALRKLQYFAFFFLLATLHTWALPTGPEGPGGPKLSPCVGDKRVIYTVISSTPNQPGSPVLGPFNCNGAHAPEDDGQ